MGLLRLLLALSVVAAHAGPILGLSFFGNGVMAVESFYMLSGFYMALILRGRYKHSLGDFYFNRFLRLFPSFWVITLACFVLAAVYRLLVGHPIGVLVGWSHPGGLGSILLGVLLNISILGTDTLALLGALRPDFHTHSLIALQPAWSLSVELIFYLFAPALLRKGLLPLLGGFLLAALLHGSLWSLSGYQWSVWLYYFSPASWLFFLGGALAHRLHELTSPLPWFQSRARHLGYGLTGLLLLLICFHADSCLLGFRDWRYYTLLGLSLPFVFEASRTSRLDTALGDCSYPLYLCHWGVLMLYAPLRHFVPGSLKGATVLCLALLASLLILRFDQKLRQRFKRAPQR